MKTIERHRVSRFGKRLHRPFTLIEVVLCIALLSLAAAGIGWQLIGVVAVHRFDSDVKKIYQDLKRCQLIALCNRTDIEYHIFTKEGKIYSEPKCDDPLPYFRKKQGLLKSIGGLSLEGKRISSHCVYFDPTGGFAEQKLILFSNKGESYTLDLSVPVVIGLKRGSDKKGRG